MLKVVNIEHCFAKFSDTFSPKIVGELNGQHVKVVRVEGDKVPWHATTARTRCSSSSRERWTSTSGRRP